MNDTLFKRWFAALLVATLVSGGIGAYKSQGTYYRGLESIDVLALDSSSEHVPPFKKESITQKIESVISPKEFTASVLTAPPQVQDPCKKDEMPVLKKGKVTGCKAPEKVKGSAAEVSKKPGRKPKVKVLN